MAASVLYLYVEGLNHNNLKNTIYYLNDIKWYASYMYYVVMKVKCLMNDNIIIICTHKGHFYSRREGGI